MQDFLLREGPVHSLADGRGNAKFKPVIEWTYKRSLREFHAIKMGDTSSGIALPNETSLKF
jgi:hypothetical protein